MTWVGIALLVLLIGVDAAIWFSRSEDNAAATPFTPESAGKSKERTTPKEPGDYVTSEVVSADRLVTDHYLITRDEVRSVQLKIRSTGYADFEPSVQELTVFADGREVPDPEPPTKGSPSRIQLGEPSKVVRLRYVTNGAVVASVPSRSGRALALANPVKVRADDPAGRHVIRVDGQVLSLSCAPGNQAARNCGRVTDMGWQVTRDKAKYAVLAPVDSPD